MKIELPKEIFYRVQKSDTYNTICEYFNTDKTSIIRNNNSIDLYAGEIIKIVVNDFFYYTIKPTETLEKVCEKFSVSKEDVINLNSLKDGKVFIGLRLKIPRKKG